MIVLAASGMLLGFVILPLVVWCEIPRLRDWLWHRKAFAGVVEHRRASDALVTRRWH